jgi:peptidoglycan-N-acetylglucosamine deacetylase
MNQKELIFYDRKKRRKFYFRTLAVILTSAFLWGTIDIAMHIATANPFEKVYTMDDYKLIDNDKKIALTFDDGPDSKYTEMIIDILKYHDVPGTFFFIGENILIHRDAVKRSFDSGMEIGVHTFTHAYSVHDSYRRLSWELNATNKLIEEITGHSAILYRPPYLLNIGSDPTLYPQSEEEPLVWSSQIGFIPVGANIDPKDWIANSPREIIDNFNAQAENGNLVLLHDGPGPATIHMITALDIIIRDYKEKGYEFVTVSEILGLTREQVMPPVSKKDNYGYLDGLVIGSATSAVPIAFSIMSLVIILVFGRLFFLFLLFIAGSGRKHSLNNKEEYTGKVSILVPAYNEEENIASTIDSLARNDYEDKEIIVIDDGSKDKTAQIVKDLQKIYPGLIQLIQVPNGGKAKALNVGINAAKGEVFVAVDGDSIFKSDAVRMLVRHFSDKDVGAVAGKIDVINSSNLLDSMQKLEYLTGQNLEKRALASIGAVNIVPGPVGAWRKEYVLKAGGYKTDTLVEDQDLSYAIHNLGKKVIFEPAAISYTETPHTIKNFIKQRFRWNFGTLQCLWKYKFNLLRFKNWPLGWVILPNALIFNIFIPIFYPLVDLIAVGSLFTSHWPKVLAALLIYTIVDSLYVAAALFLERKHYKLILLVPLQRLVYRQIMYIIIFKSLIKAIEGTAAFWNKFERQGSIQKFYFDLIGEAMPAATGQNLEKKSSISTVK